MCEKKPYLNYRHAANDAKAINRRHHEPKEVYHCRTCQAWHVGDPTIGRTRDKRRDYTDEDHEH